MRGKKTLFSTKKDKVYDASTIFSQLHPALLKAQNGSNPKKRLQWFGMYDRPPTLQPKKEKEKQYTI